MDFSCVEGCSKCCIEREYYPSIRFGKIGVLLLPSEIEKIDSLARIHSISITILPRVGVSKKPDHPEKILGYQLMGRESNGNTCPFLDTESDQKSPHGGYKCRIYQDRPLACRAFPLIGSSPPALDPKCRFCEKCPTADGNIDSEIKSLSKIKSGMETGERYIWRYATGVGEPLYKEKVETGWFLV